MTVRTDVLVLDRRLYVAGVGQTIATVPVGERWLIRELVLNNADVVLTSRVIVDLRRTNVSYPLREGDVVAGGRLWFPGMFGVMAAGDQLRVASIGAVTVALALFGARLVV